MNRTQAVRFPIGAMREPLEAMAADRGNKPSAIIREALRHFFLFSVQAGFLPDDYLPGSPWTDDSIQVKNGGGKRVKKPSNFLSCHLDELDRIARLFNENYRVPCAKQIQLTLAIWLKKNLKPVYNYDAESLFAIVIENELNGLVPDTARLYSKMLEN